MFYYIKKLLVVGYKVVIVVFVMGCKGELYVMDMLLSFVN